MPRKKAEQVRDLTDSLHELERSLTNYFQAEAVSRESAGKSFLVSLEGVRLNLKTATIEIDDPLARRVSDAMKDIRIEDLNNADVIARHLRDEAKFHPWNFD